jgi:hypothetical protein
MAFARALLPVVVAGMGMLLRGWRIYNLPCSERGHDRDGHGYI